MKVQEKHKCSDCGGRFDRPGVAGCSIFKHVKPTLAQQIVMTIETSLVSKLGLREAWDHIDEDTQQVVRDEWVQLIQKLCQEHVLK